MNSVITFDVSSNLENLVREQMRATGYYIAWDSTSTPDKKTIYLPHNMVWKPNTESQQALSDIQQAIAIINQRRAAGDQIRLLRCVILNSTPWRAVYGEPIQS